MEYKYRIEDITEKLYRCYSLQHDGVSVNFRKELPSLNGTERFSHCIHSYPAKLIAHIPYFFLNNKKFIDSGGIVLDPFCGSGTTLLEANLLGINALGADANPLARLISKCKTKPIKKDCGLRLMKVILNESHLVDNTDSLWFKNIDLWFSPRVQTDLSKLYVSINNIRKGKYRDFFLMCFSATLGKTSYTDPRISVPVKINANRFMEGSKEKNNALALLEKIDHVNVFKTFEGVCRLNLKRICTLEKVEKRGWTRVISEDARRLTEKLGVNKLLPDESVDLVLTSPPYASAQKHIRSSSLS